MPWQGGLLSVLSREGAPWRNWSHNTARNASLEARRSKKHPRGLSGKRKLANLRIEGLRIEGIEDSPEIMLYYLAYFHHRLKPATTYPVNCPGKTGRFILGEH